MLNQKKRKRIIILNNINWAYLTCYKRIYNLTHFKSQQKDEEKRRRTFRVLRYMCVNIKKYKIKWIEFISCPSQAHIIMYISFCEKYTTSTRRRKYKFQRAYFIFLFYKDIFKCNSFEINKKKAYLGICENPDNL